MININIFCAAIHDLQAFSFWPIWTAFVSMRDPRDRQSSFAYCHYQDCSHWLLHVTTVDGGTPAPPWMVETLWIMGWTTYQLLSIGAGFRNHPLSVFTTAFMTSGLYQNHPFNLPAFHWRPSCGWSRNSLDTGSCAVRFRTDSKCGGVSTESNFSESDTFTLAYQGSSYHISQATCHRVATRSQMDSHGCTVNALPATRHADDAGGSQ